MPPLALTPTPTPLPPVRAVTAHGKIAGKPFPPYSPCSPTSFSDRIKLRLRIRRNPSPAFGVLIKCGGAVREIDETQFSDVVLKSERPVLVEFVATWCGPCRLIAPAVQSLAQEYEDKMVVVKVDHDSNPRLIEEYKVYGLPTLIFFQNGKEIPESRREGAITKAKLKLYVDELLESVSRV